MELRGEVLTFPLVRTSAGPMWLPPGGKARAQARVIQHRGADRLVGLRAEIGAGVSVGGHWHDCAERLIVHEGVVELGWIREESQQEDAVTLRAGDSHTLTPWVLHWARYVEDTKVQCDFIAEPGQLPGLGVSWVPAP